MSYPPKGFIKSRENLQAMCKTPDIMIKYQLFDNILAKIWVNIQYPVSKKSLKYIINLNDGNYNPHRFVFNQTIALEFIEVLKKEYPGVDFTYKETLGYDGTILENIIIMDWSKESL